MSLSGPSASKKRKSTVSKATKRSRLTADSLQWKTVKTSTLPGMDDGGGMMMLEELDGVGVEWEEGEGGSKLARYIALEDEAESSGDAAKADIMRAEGQGPAGSQAADDSEGEKEIEEVEEEEFTGFGSESDEEPLPDFSRVELEVDEADNEATLEEAFDDALLPAWSDISVPAALKRALLALGFVEPTAIQGRSLQSGLENRDIVGVAETGSGKTLAYSLPILSFLLRQPMPEPSERRPLSALILCPTRELALQVSEHLSRVLAYALAPAEDEVRKAGPPRISIGSVIGGLSAQKQKRIVERGCDILVATPGRLWDLMGTDDELATSVRTLRFLVIDEADRMIENGHFKELEHIVGLTQRQASQQQNAEIEDPTFAQSATLLSTTSARDDMQTFVFSATLSKDLQANLKRKGSFGKKGKGKKASALEDLVEKLDFRDKNPEVIDLSPEGGVVASLKESMIDCIASDKDLYLYYFLLRYPGRSMVFVGSIDGIRRLIPLFEVLQVPVWPLHSQLQQKQRLKNLDRFKAAPNGVLIATDVAARGLDIPQVDHVIHFNLPRTADAYIHRSGRTARAQNPGFALQLVSAEEKNVQRALMKSLAREEQLPDLTIDSGFLPKLKERIRVAKAIEKAQHMVKKDNHEKNWLKETAEAMDIDIDPDMLSDGEYDADLPYHQPNKQSSNTRKTSGASLIKLKAELRELLREPLMARGVSAKYPTSGSRVIIDDLINQRGNAVMLGAGTGKAHEEVHKVRKGALGGKRKRETGRATSTRK
ncbi:ATP-dependent RNA helicase DDX24/MAK5, partial [Tremellales sp. Uapishka_1]